MTASKNFSFDLFKVAENWFRIFCIYNKQWWIAK